VPGDRNKDRNETMSHMYSAKTTALGGRSGFASSSDGRLRVELSTPAALGGDDGPGTNPEQLFAAAQAASLLAAIRQIAKRKGLSLSAHSNVTATIDLEHPDGDDDAADLMVRLAVDIPCIDVNSAREIVAEAVKICPYTRAMRGTVLPQLAVD
jgi:osmotically inducible protein OsmC